MGKNADDCGIPHAARLIEFVESVTGDDATRLDTARRDLIAALGQAGFVDAASVVSAFDGLDRIADATGVQIEEDKAIDTAELRTELGIDDFPSMQSR